MTFSKIPPTSRQNTAQITPQITSMITGSSGGKSANTGPSTYIAPDTIRSDGEARLLYLLSAGPITGLADQSNAVRLNDIPLGGGGSQKSGQKPGQKSPLPDVSWQLLHGLPGQDIVPLSGFNQTAQTQILSRQLRPDIPVIFGRKPADAARLTFRFPRGLVHRTPHVVGPAAVTFTIEVSDDAENPDWREVGREIFREKQTSAFEFQRLIPFPPTARHPAIRLTRLSPAATDAGISDSLYLSSVTWLLEDKLNYDGLSLFALSVGAKAFDGRLPTLSLDIKGRAVKIPDNYTLSSRSYNGTWSGKFVTGWSDNPAWVILDLLTDKAWGLGLSLDVIDRFDLYALARHCDEMIDEGTGIKKPRFTFNAILNKRMSAARLIAEICASVRTLFFWSGGKLHFRYDQYTPPRLLVTNSSVLDGHFMYHSQADHQQISHALVTYLNARGEPSLEIDIDHDRLRTHGYRASEVFVRGCTNAAQARRHARWLLSAQKTGSKAVSYRASLDHMADHPIRPGDIIQITDDRLPTSRPQDAQQVLRLERAPYKAILDKLKIPGHQVGQHDKVYIVRQKPNFKTTRAHFMGYPRPAPQNPAPQNPPTQNSPAQNPPPQILEGDFEFHASLSQPEQDIYILRHRRETSASPLVAEGSPLSLSTAHPENFWQISEIKQIAADQVEIIALSISSQRDNYIDSQTPTPTIAKPTRPTPTDPLPTIAQITHQQFEKLNGSTLLYDIELSWTLTASTNSAPANPAPANPAPANYTAVQFWQIEMTAPDNSRQFYYSPRPHIIIPASSPGDYAFTLHAIDWLGRPGPKTAYACTLLPDIASLPAPAMPKIKPLAGGGEITWTPPPIPAIAFYEIWQLNARQKPKKHLLTLLTSPAILTGLPPSTPLHLALRYQRVTGTYSPFSPALSLTPLPLPQGEKGEKGDQGETGTRGAPGTPGETGDIGPAGTQTLSVEVKTKSFSSSQADRAIQAAADRPPQKGDLITQINKAAGNIFTRIYDGTVWRASSPHFDGNQLIDGTIAARALRIDSATLTSTSDGRLKIGALSADHISSGRLTSPGYSLGKSGFTIDMRGSAEFNDVKIRGAIEGSKVTSSILVSPLILRPTKAGDRFLTLHDNRRVTFQTLTQSQNKLTMHNLRIAGDHLDDLYADEDNLVLAYDDRHGDNSAGTENNYYSRFRSSSPLLTFRTFYEVPDGQTPWGQHVRGVDLELIMRSGVRILATTGQITDLRHRLSQDVQSRTTTLKVSSASFTGDITFKTIRSHQSHPTDSPATSGFTRRLALEFKARPHLSTLSHLPHQPLSVDLVFTIFKKGTIKHDPLTSFKNNIEFEMDTLS